MKRLATFLALLVVPLAHGADESKCPARMTPAVEKLLVTVLEGLRIAEQSGDWFGRHYEDRFYALLESKDASAPEARVALMDYYVGEHNGEELVCAVALDGEKVQALIELYNAC